MQTMASNYITSKTIILSLITAILLHAIIIIMTKLVNINTIVEVEPKIILELIKDIPKITPPIINKIDPPKILEPPKIIKPQEMTRPSRPIIPEVIKNNIVPNKNPNEINIPNDLKPIINNKIDIPKSIQNNTPDLKDLELPNITQPLSIKKNIIDIPKPIQNNTPDLKDLELPNITQPLSIKKNIIDIPKPIQNNTPDLKDLELPKITQPLSIKNNTIDVPRPIQNNTPDLKASNLPKISQPAPIKKTTKPLKSIILPHLPVIQEINNISNKAIHQVQELPKKPVKKIKISEDVKKEIKDNITSDEISELNNYKNKIRNIIQSVAINNYPSREFRRGVQGKVQIIFKLRLDGTIEYIKSGPNTNASEKLIQAAIESVSNSAPFEITSLLKKKNEFSIDIIYKINR